MESFPTPAEAGMWVSSATPPVAQGALFSPIVRQIQALDHGHRSVVAHIGLLFWFRASFGLRSLCCLGHFTCRFAVTAERGSSGGSNALSPVSVCRQNGQWTRASTTCKKGALLISHDMKRHVETGITDQSGPVQEAMVNDGGKWLGQGKRN